NANEDPKVKFTVKDDRPFRKSLSDAMVVKGKPLILVKIWVWAESMFKEE
ncbi:activator of 90 kDa heat shock protein ATPase, partial [Trifolium medium]|nr:activator of 90 kDa heat shock protein ATPase [Trifolium medium]